MCLTFAITLVHPIKGHRQYTRIAKFRGQHGNHLSPVGPRLAPCWSHEPWYQRCYSRVTSSAINYIILYIALTVCKFLTLYLKTNNAIYTRRLHVIRIAYTAIAYHYSLVEYRYMCMCVCTLRYFDTSQISHVVPIWKKRKKWYRFPRKQLITWYLLMWCYYEAYHIPQFILSVHQWVVLKAVTVIFNCYRDSNPAEIKEYEGSFEYLYCC